MVGIFRINQHFFLFCLAGIIVLLFNSCGTSSKLSGSRWEQIDFSTLPGVKEHPDADAITLLDEGKLEVFVQNTLPFSIFEEHKVIRILTDRGSNYANIIIPYSGRSEVEGIEARTIVQNGKIVQLDPSTIYDVSLYPNFVFYSDQRAKIFTLPAVEKGAIIEYQYRITIHDPMLWPEWNFQDMNPTIHSTFTLISPSEWNVSYRNYGNVAEPQLKKAPQGFKSTRIWDVKNIPALRTEIAMPSIRDVSVRVALAPAGIKSWDDVSMWFNELWNTKMSMNLDLREFSHRLTLGCKTDEEKLKKIFDWVRDNIRYIAVEIGTGGFQPHSADEVLRNRYGDCKDMTVLLCTLAQEASLEVHPAFISTWFHSVTDTSLPSPLQFNHVIAYDSLPHNRIIWMDVTDKGCSFPALPWYDQNRPSLVVKKNGKGEIISTPRSSAQENSTKLQWNITLSSTGDATITGNSVMKGAVASDLQNILLYTPYDRQRSWCEAYLTQYCSSILLDSFSISPFTPPADSLEIEYVFHTNAFSQLTDNGLTIRPWQIEMLSMPDYLRSAQRIHPIRSQYGESVQTTLRINLPKNYRQLKPNQSDSLSSQFGRSRWQYQQDGLTLTATKEYLMFGDDISQKEYPQFQQFIDNIRRNDLREIIISQPR